jgi:glycosyltransferase involved in cell wall biosynthesis
VVASAVGEQAAYGAQGAATLLPPTATPAEFAQAVRQLLQNPAQRVAMIAQARQHLVDHYQWRMLGQTLTAFYQGDGF